MVSTTSAAARAATVRGGRTALMPIAQTTEEAFNHAMAVTPRACSSPSGTPARGRADRRHLDVATVLPTPARGIYSASKAAIEQRLTVALEVAEQALKGPPGPLNAESVLAATSRGFWQISGKWRSELREEMRCAWWS
jgi:hypothetical protein